MLTFISDGVAILSELVARWRFFCRVRADSKEKSPAPPTSDDEQQLLEHIGAWLLPLGFSPL